MHKVKLPNFLIVGAAKSGTTSLHHYLKQHPEVCMPKIKETFFFTGESWENIKPPPGRSESEKVVITSMDEYKNLFDIKKNTKAIGEACNGYLYYYEKSISNIKHILLDPKIVVILRNPIDRAFSGYLHHMRDGFENFSFEEALKLEQKREKDKWWWGYQYIKMGFYYKQVNAYIENFSQVKIYLYDDLKKDTLGLVKDMYEFLEVDSSFIPDVSIKYNVTGVPKNKFLHEFLTKPNIFKSMIKPIVKVMLEKEKSVKLVEDLKAKNLAKPGMKPETREYLKNIYCEDIIKFQDLINRDLTHWLR